MLAADLNLRMQLVAVRLVVPFVPLRSVLGGMPAPGCLDGFRRNTSLMPRVVMGHVIAGKPKLQIAWRVVGLVVVSMVDVVASRRLPTIGRSPHHSMKADTISLKVLAAEIVPRACKLLAGARDDDRRAHDFSLWTLRDTSS